MTKNPHDPRSYPKGWTWAQHKLHGMVGGNDYEVPAGTKLESLISGVAHVAAGDVLVKHRSGWSIETLEVAHALVKTGDHVTVGDLIVQTGEKYIHEHGISPAGKRVPWATALKKITQYETAHKPKVKK